MEPLGSKALRWGTWLGPALTVVLLVSLPASGADRRVLCEEFTAVT